MGWLLGSLEAVFRHGVRSSAGELAALRRTLAAGSMHARLADAVLAQFDGDVGRCDRILRSAWQSASSNECGFVADLWVPIVISLQRFEEVDAILADPRVDRDAMTFAALRCVLAAVQGDAAASLALAGALEAGRRAQADPLPPVPRPPSFAV